MRTKIFAYKGVLGIESSDLADGLMNEPNEKGQLGFVLDARFVDIQPEALKILKRIERSDDENSELDIFKIENDIVVIAWIGSSMMVFYPEKTTGNSSYNPDLIKRTVSFKTPKAFKKFVEGGRKNEKPKSKRKRKR